MLLVSGFRHRNLTSIDNRFWSRQSHAERAEEICELFQSKLVKQKIPWLVMSYNIRDKDIEFEPSTWIQHYISGLSPEKNRVGGFLKKCAVGVVNQ